MKKIRKLKEIYDLLGFEVWMLKYCPEVSYTHEYIFNFLMRRFYG
jgi:hypothetical protein